jgi:hypothetical protein
LKGRWTEEQGRHPWSDLFERVRNSISILLHVEIPFDLTKDQLHVFIKCSSIPFVQPPTSNIVSSSIFSVLMVVLRWKTTGDGC